MSQSLNSPPTANISTTNNFFHHQQFSTNNNFLHPQAATRVGTGWSYLVAWAGVCLTLVASFFIAFIFISTLLFRSLPFLCFYFCFLGRLIGNLCLCDRSQGAAQELGGGRDEDEAEVE